MADSCGRDSAVEKKQTHHVQNVTDSDFIALLKQTDKPVLVDFWAPWCGPCKQLGPVIAQLGKDYNEKILVVKINVDKHKKVASDYKIRGIPTVMVFQNGELKERLTGVQSKATYTKVLNKLLENGETT